MGFVVGYKGTNFYPRPPCGERRQRPISVQQKRDFYPRSPCGERPRRTAHSLCRRVFLSTLSLRRATPSGSKYSGCSAHFYPRSPCGERLRGERHANSQQDISIHALLAESDDRIVTSRQLPTPFLSTLSLRRATGRPGVRPPALPISIHALLAESDNTRITALFDSPLFLSTLSLRRATGRRATSARAT